MSSELTRTQRYEVEDLIGAAIEEDITPMINETEGDLDTKIEHLEYLLTLLAEKVALIEKYALPHKQWTRSIPTKLEQKRHDINNSFMFDEIPSLTDTHPTALRELLKDYTGPEPSSSDSECAPAPSATNRSLRTRAETRAKRHRR